MNENQMDTYVRKRFGMDLFEFMRQKVETESLFNYEVADLLKVDTKIVSAWRRAFGLRRGNVFFKRFDKKYGKGAVDTFKRMIDAPEITLADVGRYFGFTREYARQAYLSVFGKSYSEGHKKKKMVQNTNINNPEVINDPPEILKCVFSRIKSIGLEPEYINDNKRLRVMVNGYRLCAKFSSSPFPIGRKQYYRIIFDCLNNFRDFDFCICVLKNEETDICYIIPASVLPERSIALCPDVIPGNSKYSCYREAWYLLADRQDDFYDQRIKGILINNISHQKLINAS